MIAFDDREAVLQLAAAPPAIPRKMIGPDEALALVLHFGGRPRTELVPLDRARGRRLAAAVCADRPYPAFRRAMMDGYAVVATDAGRTVDVAGQIAAGDESPLVVKPGAAVEIMTGAACPPGTEAVVQKEAVRRQGEQVELPHRIEPGMNIAPIGSECQADARVLAPGDAVTPLAIAAMASFGIERVEVVRRPSLSIITTGAELVAPGVAIGRVQIRDSNGPMLAAMARDLGIEPRRVDHADDTREATLAALRHTEGDDIVILSGGVSAGRFDLAPDALREHGAEIVFHKVSQKPGKPLLLARRGEQLLFGLPGNPLACHLGFHRYVAAAIRLREGREPLPLPSRGVLAAPARGHPHRVSFVLARAERTTEEEGWQLRPLGGVSSADIFTPATANCYLRLPPGGDYAPGEPAAFLWIRPEE